MNLMVRNQAPAAGKWGAPRTLRGGDQRRLRGSRSVLLSESTGACYSRSEVANARAAAHAMPQEGSLRPRFGLGQQSKERHCHGRPQSTHFTSFNHKLGPAADPRDRGS